MKKSRREDDRRTQSIQARLDVDSPDRRAVPEFRCKRNECVKVLGIRRVGEGRSIGRRCPCETLDSVPPDHRVHVEMRDVIIPKSVDELRNAPDPRMHLEEGEKKPSSSSGRADGNEVAARNPREESVPSRGAPHQAEDGHSSKRSENDCYVADLAKLGPFDPPQHRKPTERYRAIERESTRQRTSGRNHDPESSQSQNRQRATHQPNSACH